VMKMPLAVLVASMSVLMIARTGESSVVDSLKKTYADIKAVEARFEQKIYIVTFKKERLMSGQFFYKRSRGFLWKYTFPKEKTFLYDGKVVWQAEDDKPYVTRERVNRDKMGGTFLDLVDDVTRLDEFFIVRQGTKEDGLNVLELTPKKEGTIAAARIWVDPQFLISKIEIREITGNINTITFSSIRSNNPLDNSLFVFSPGSKEVVDQ
jgi:chaperone LolA